jgi:hypothetical protein
MVIVLSLLRWYVSTISKKESAIISIDHGKNAELRSVG